MKTILFNTDTNETTGIIREGYYTVDGVRPELPANIVELEVRENERPTEYDKIKQYTTFEWQRNGIYWEQTWLIVDRTEEELNDVLDMIDQQLDSNAIKRFLQKIAEPIIADEANLTEQDIADAATIYPVYRPNKPYIVSDVFGYNGELFEVVQSHTSQLDWIPDELPALYKKFTPAGQIAEWVQPLGAQDAYQIGDKVTHNGFTWESTVANNVWEPGVFGWVKI